MPPSPPPSPQRPTGRIGLSSRSEEVARAAAARQRELVMLSLLACPARRGRGRRAHTARA